MFAIEPQEEPALFSTPRGFESLNPQEIDAVRIRLLNPARIKELSRGEVTNSHLYDIEGRPVPNGLFCEKIFGTERSNQCGCGKYRKSLKYRGLTCPVCGVTVEDATVRRQYWGHISFATPVIHIWYISTLALLLNIPPKIFNAIVHCDKYLVLNPGNSAYKKGDIITYREYFEQKRVSRFIAETGGELIEQLLSLLNLERLYKLLKNSEASKRVSPRLLLVRNLLRSGINPSWMVLREILVLPPGLRPYLFMSDGTTATSDVNELYARVINRNRRLKVAQEHGSAELLKINDIRLLQLGVDALFQNGKTTESKDRAGKRVLKSLTDAIQTKKGRFRRNLLGKRVDYSARSVIAPGPTLKLNQCGLPKDLAMDMCRPFVYQRLLQIGYASSLRHARRLVDLKRVEAMEALEYVIEEKVVLLNRAPSLHRMSFQAFDPVLIEGKAIRLHPFVCSAFNADFDGDQMGVHLPLSVEAQVECRLLAGSVNNIFSPATGKPVTLPSQEIVLGIYYLTKEREGCRSEGKVFADADDVVTAYQQEAVELQSKIRVRMENEIVATTPGRVLFSLIFPPQFPYSSLNRTIKKKDIGQLVEQCYNSYGHRETVILLDKLKETGFHYATLSGISFCIDDATIPKEKSTIVTAAKKAVEEVQQQYLQTSLITDDERHNKVVEIWKAATEQITKKMMDNFGMTETEELVSPQEKKNRREFNSIFMMADSGARGSTEQIRQLAGMRGLMAKPNGDIVEIPIISNLREGQTYMEFLLASHGARKGRADGALKTANAGYFTRRLVYAAQGLVITEKDCGVWYGIEMTGLYNDDVLILPVKDRIVGRVAAEDVRHPETGELITNKGEIITKKMGGAIDAAEITTVHIRSPFTCRSAKGICSMCYGMDLSTRRLVEVGHAVGIIAAQSIGEPGTQLTLRTFHSGGTASGGKQKAEIIAQEAGELKYEGINIVQNSRGRRVAINRSGRLALSCQGRIKDLGRVPYGAILLSADGEMVEAGQTVVTWEPFAVPIVAPQAGIVEYSAVIEGVTVKKETDENGLPRQTVISSGKNVTPRIVISESDIHLPVGAILLTREGEKVEPGDVIAKVPKDAQQSMDITSGLPRVLQILEARKLQPKDQAILSEISGEVTVSAPLGKTITVTVRPSSGDGKRYSLSSDRPLNVYSGDIIAAGDAIAEGSVAPGDVLHIFGPIRAAQFIVDEVQKVYQSQGVATDDKHFELIARKMLEMVEISDPGNTDSVEGEVMTRQAFFTMNNNATGNKAKAKSIIVGLAQVGRLADSWLSAASFERTVKALRDAALNAVTDYLQGTKENIIIGRIIPVGTGIYQKEMARKRPRRKRQST